MTAYALVIVLATHTAGLVPVTWHATRERCEQQMAVEMTVIALRGQQAVSAACQRIPMPRLAPATGEMVR